LSFPLLGLAIYYACQAIPCKDASELLSVYDSGFADEVRRYQIIGIAAFCAFAIIGCVTLPGALRRLRSARPNALVVALWGLLLTWALVGTYWSIAPSQTAQYTVLTGVLIVGCTLFWSWPPALMRSAMGFAAVTGAVSMAYLAMTLPAVDRSFGGIPPNFLGHFGFAIIVLSYAAGFMRPLALATGFVLLYYAQARTVLGTTVLYLIFYHVVMPRITDRRSLVRYTFATIPLSVAGALLIGPLITFGREFTNVAAHVTDRGRAESFSGREQIWAHAQTLIANNPVLGYGYRTRGISVGGIADSGHSGLLNCMLDLGLVGTVMFVLLCVFATWASLVRWTESRATMDRVAASFLVGIVPTLLVEPNYLNFSHPTSFLLFIFMVRAAVDYRDVPRRVAGGIRRPRPTAAIRPAMRGGV
jgi:O-antigen ligase